MWNLDLVCFLRIGSFPLVNGVFSWDDAQRFALHLAAIESSIPWTAHFKVFKSVYSQWFHCMADSWTSYVSFLSCFLWLNHSLHFNPRLWVNPWCFQINQMQTRNRRDPEAEGCLLTSSKLCVFVWELFRICLATLHQRWDIYRRSAMVDRSRVCSLCRTTCLRHRRSRGSWTPAATTRICTRPKRKAIPASIIMTTT